MAKKAALVAISAAVGLFLGAAAEWHRWQIGNDIRRSRWFLPRGMK